MLAELQVRMRDAAAIGGTKLPSSPTASIVWGFSLAEILKVLLDQALVLGREYRTELEGAAKSAIDAVVAFDLPWIPAGIENTLDNITRSAGYAAVDAILDAILGKPN